MKTLKHSFILNALNKTLYHLKKIYHSRGSAHEIALGAAIGAFWGVFPTFGLSTVLSLFLYKVIRFNLLAALSAAFISNPFTSPFLLLISYKVGCLFIDTQIEFKVENWDQNLSQIGYVILVGSFWVSLTTGVLVYFVVKRLVENRRRRKLNPNNHLPHDSGKFIQ